MTFKMFPIINLPDQLNQINRAIASNSLTKEYALCWLNTYGEVIDTTDSVTFAYKSRFGFESLHYFTIENGNTVIKQHHWI